MLLVLLALAAAPVAAGASTMVTVTWQEDAIRYNPDGTIKSTWFNDPLGPMTLLQTGKAYHSVDIVEYYNYPGLENVEGSLVISGGGSLAAHVTYTSPYSGLPIRDLLRGNVTVDPDAGTLAGTYTQFSYAFGSRDEVLAYYPNAVPDKEPDAKGWWFIGYTDYVAH